MLLNFEPRRVHGQVVLRSVLATGKQRYREPQQKVRHRKERERMTLTYIEMRFRCTNEITGLGVPVKPFLFISASGAGPIP